MLHLMWSKRVVVGGAAYILGANATLTNINVSNSTADSDGGALAMISSSLIADHLIVLNTIAYGSGGGLFSEHSGSVVMIDSNLMNYGGGIYVTGDSQSMSFDLTRTNIYDCQSNVCIPTSLSYS
jgi:hypothetical protein